MKKVIFTLFSICAMYANTNAQSCGTSSTTQCTPIGTMTKPGLSPTSSELPAIDNGVVSTTIIQFKNYDTTTYAPLGILVTVQNLKIDSINNLPAGLCWATNKSNDTYANQEDGCIKIIGTTCADPGVYKLKIKVTATVVGLGAIPVDAEDVGLRYFVRVKNCGDATVALDSTQTVPFSKPAGYSATQNCVCSVGISDVASTINSLNVVPNPFSNRAVVHFFSEKATVVTERITNMIGSEVLNREIEVKVGENNFNIDGTTFAPGVYFYSIGTGKSLVTKRIVISE